MRRSAGVRAVFAALAACAACAVFAAPASAQICDAPSGTAAAAGASIPSPADVLGFSLGERFTTTEEVERYARALDDASELVELREYGRTPEDRPLLQLVIARPERHARLEAIARSNRRLTDPALRAAEANDIAARGPAVVWLSYGVHGNESSSTEAALWTAWDLARGASTVGGVLDSLVVVIDPMANPDGRARYVGWYRQAMGAQPNPNPDAREHWEPWPGGRYNHWLFDLNRDWAFLTQPETRARLASWDEWSPQVHIDFHEMSFTSSYFFFPAAPPINPIYPRHVLEWGEWFGAANAETFDRCGWAYFTGEDYDFFYPGYGDTWPSLTGAIGLTYEQAGGGRAGLAVERPDGGVLTLADRAQHHRASGAATLRAAAARKTHLLRDFARFHRESAADARNILLIPDQAGRAEALVDALLAQGIEVRRAARAFTAGAAPHAAYSLRREFPSGTYLVPARQARGRLATTLLVPNVELDATYSYDLTAWSLPYAFGVEAHSVPAAPDAGWRAVERPTALLGEVGVAGGAAEDSGAKPYALLVRPRLDAWPGLIRFLEAGGRGRVAAESFTAAGRVWPAGTVVLPRWSNADLSARAARAGLGGLAVPVRTGLTEFGSDIGTERAFEVELPRVALISGPGVAATSFGAHWFFLEQTLKLPFDAVPLDRIRNVDLADYDVVVLPETTARLDSTFVETTRGWIERGGTLIAVGSAAEAVADTLGGIEIREALEDSAATESDRLERALRGRRERDLAEWEQEVAGSVLAVRLDPAHPLAYGAGAGGDSDRMFVLHVGDLVFEPDESFESAAWFEAGLTRTSGVISDENLERLSRGTWLATRSRGDGRIVLFADDPLFRHFWYSSFVPYVNAIMLRF
ncbi:MAG TPA: M14 family metallopeptidase [Longimicrobiales bacterium]|nr:M14 family metallopeptidase [Longimicrobiales bacterium]